MPKSSAVIANIAHRAAVKATQPLTSELHKRAEDAGWPADVASALYLSLKGNHLVVKYPSSYKQKVEAAEYGTEDVPPAPIIRKFMYDLPKLMRPYLEKELKNSVSEVVEVL